MNNGGSHGLVALLPSNSCNCYKRIRYLFLLKLYTRKRELRYDRNKRIPSAQPSSNQITPLHNLQCFKNKRIDKIFSKIIPLLFNGLIMKLVCTPRLTFIWNHLKLCRKLLLLYTRLHFKCFSGQFKNNTSHTKKAKYRIGFALSPGDKHMF